MDTPLETVLALPNIKSIIEIGCCQMEDTATFRKRWPDATIWCFEPDPRNTIYIQASGIDADLNVRFLPVAISDKCGVELFYLSHPWHKSSSLLRPKRCSVEIEPETKFTFLPHPIEVHSMTLDEVLPREKFDLLWIDTQGAEQRVIKGATETLKKTSYILMEHNTCGDYEGAPNLDTLVDMLPGWKVVFTWPYDVLLKRR